MVTDLRQEDNLGEETLPNEEIYDYGFRLTPYQFSLF